MNDIRLDDIVNTYIQARIQDVCVKEGIVYADKYRKYKIESTAKEKKQEKKARRGCFARVKNNGFGRRCSRSAIDGTDFCTAHNKVVGEKKAWQTLGRIDEIAPPIFIQWYKNKGIYIRDAESFYAKKNPENMSEQELKDYSLSL